MKTSVTLTRDGEQIDRYYPLHESPNVCIKRFGSSILTVGFKNFTTDQAERVADAFTKASEPQAFTLETRALRWLHTRHRECGLDCVFSVQHLAEGLGCREIDLLDHDYDRGALFCLKQDGLVEISGCAGNWSVSAQHSGIQWG